MPFDSQTARSARCRRSGLKRAAYWRAQGFPNLLRARAAKALYRLEREKLLALATNQPAPPNCPLPPLNQLPGFQQRIRYIFS